MDLFTVPTIRFRVLYVFIIVSHARRRIEHFGVTTNPTAAWVKQQVRNATPFGKQPKYLLHDNDSIFTAGCLQAFLSNANIKSVRTAYCSPWQNGICERTVGIIRQEVLNHIIPLDENHLHSILHRYIDGYYNSHRTHQGIGCRTPDIKPRPPKTTIAETKLVSTELLGGLYHTYEKVA
jgi:transposase InsO family protein